MWAPQRSGVQICVKGNPLVLNKSDKVDGDPLKATVEMFNIPAFQALFRITATILLLFISVVTYIAVQTLGNIKELTNTLRITEVIGEGRVTSATILNHDRRLTGLEQWRVTLPPVRREAP